MKYLLMAVMTVEALVSCSSFDPLDHKNGLYSGPSQAKRGPGVTAQFLGNTTIHFTDGTTHLLVDGFFTRPNHFKTLGVGKIQSDVGIVEQQLRKAGISTLDGLLLGHAHADHALDAPTVAKRFPNACVMANASYRNIHLGARGDDCQLFTVPKDGNQKKFGDFTVTFVESEHIPPRNFVQRRIVGCIENPLEPPAPFSDYKCGQVYAIHIAHRDGSFLITTTAAATDGKLDKYHADVAFLAIGLLGDEELSAKEKYWNATVKAVGAKVVVPVHWDDFSRKITEDGKLAPEPSIIDDLGKTVGWLKNKEGCVTVKYMGMNDSFRTVGRVIQ